MAYVRSSSGQQTNDVNLAGINNASIGFLNNSYKQFNYIPGIPWTFYLDGDSPYHGRIHDASY